MSEPELIESVTWSRSDGEAINNDTHWTSKGCSCCSKSFGFDTNEFAVYDPVSIVQMRVIVNSLRSQLILAERDLASIKAQGEEYEEKRRIWKEQND